jgi:hypothetical protein
LSLSTRFQPTSSLKPRFAGVALLQGSQGAEVGRRDVAAVHVGHLFNSLTLLQRAATLLLKLLRVRAGRLVVGTSAQDRQRVTGELAGQSFVDGTVTL